jgi:hypothetical protein
MSAEKTMRRKLSTLVAGFLLMSALTLNAQAFTTENEAVFTPTTQEVGWCWVYLGGRWWLLPC